MQFKTKISEKDSFAHADNPSVRKRNQRKMYTFNLLDLIQLVLFVVKLSPKLFISQEMTKCWKRTENEIDV